ncbi:hypothetical protein DL95DRAFT_381250 [Leptodontidium sp. 2 PMI_412]|nr:hypothetical protein DL95DRAFT_381250 [Leptodontidium sp. 2 PMI_412]
MSIAHTPTYSLARSKDPRSRILHKTLMKKKNPKRRGVLSCLIIVVHISSSFSPQTHSIFQQDTFSYPD